MKKELECTIDSKGNEVYRMYGKQYVLVDELVKGGCQGCAFYNRMDCESQGRNSICNKTHKIFMRKLEHE